jgi:hypothetical protein
MALIPLVDAYAIHTYPSGSQPGNPAADAKRAAQFTNVDMAECRPAGSKDGKPCWITEWGFPNSDVSCPTKDSGRTQLVKEMRAYFAQAAAQGRLIGAMYFTWNSDPWSKTVDPDTIYRCGELTESGREAIKPIVPAKEDSGKPKTIENSPKATLTRHTVETTAGMPCLECTRIRVGLPRIEQGPTGGIADNTFSEIQIPGSRFRGFTAAAETFAIDGENPEDMSGPLRKVLGRGAPGTFDSCGQWVQHAELSGHTVLGWVHNETDCNYKANFQTHKSMSIATSTDYGLTWKSYGQIITGKDAPTTGKITGEGDCTAVNGLDGSYYAYCWRNREGATIVARAPVSDPHPGKWMKFFQGKWVQPGLGGRPMMSFFQTSP